MREYTGDEDFEYEVRKIERERRKAERAEDRLKAKVLREYERKRLKAYSYAGRLLAWRVRSGDWRYVIEGCRGVGLAIAGGRKKLGTDGYIDAEGVPTDKGKAWVVGHPEVDLSGWERVPDPCSMAERSERAKAGSRAYWARLTPEERTARARKAGLVRGAQLRKPISSSGDM